jgi:hypothetical protein
VIFGDSSVEALQVSLERSVTVLLEKRLRITDVPAMRQVAVDLNKPSWHFTSFVETHKIIHADLLTGLSGHTPVGLRSSSSQAITGHPMVTV